MPDGLSSKDIRERAGVPVMRRNGTAMPLDPMEMALRTSREIAANKMLQQSVSETDAASIRAENEKLKAQIEQRQLLEATQQAGGGNQWQDYILKQVEGLQGQLQEAQRANAEAQAALLSDRLAMLQGEIQRLQQEREGRPEPVNPYAAARAAIEEARALVEVVSPVGPPPPPAGTDPSLEAWKLRAQYDYELRRMEAEDRRVARTRELEIEERKVSEQLRLEAARNDQLNRFFSDGMPKLLDIAQNIMTAVRTAPPPQVAASVAPEPTPPSQREYAPPVTLPPGVHEMTCQTCGSRIRYRQEWPQVTCNNCLAVYENEPEPVPAPNASPASEEVPVDEAVPA